MGLHVLGHLKTNFLADEVLVTAVAVGGLRCVVGFSVSSGFRVFVKGISYVVTCGWLLRVPIPGQ
jgi:hypothetical protein